MRQNPSVGEAACKADPAESSGRSRSARMGEIADASPQTEEHAGKERHLHRNIASTSAAASTQSLDTCSKTAVTKACVDAAVAQFIYATGTTFWVVVAISK